MLSLCFIIWFQAQQDIIEVQLTCVWVTGILGDPIYTACKNCETKVEVSILATVTLADHTGEIERVLVDGERLQLLANAKSKEDLLALLTKRGPQAVCFCHPVGVRLAIGRKPEGLTFHWEGNCVGLTVTANLQSAGRSSEARLREAECFTKKT